MMEIVDIGKDFSRYPAGRHPADGQFNGQTFREKFLTTPLLKLSKIEIRFDSAISYGSSFLEESFGGLVRVEGLTEQFLLEHIKLISKDLGLIQEILEYISEAQSEKDIT